MLQAYDEVNRVRDSIELYRAQPPFDPPEDFSAQVRELLASTDVLSDVFEVVAVRRFEQVAAFQHDHVDIGEGVPVLSELACRFRGEIREHGGNRRERIHLEPEPGHCQRARHVRSRYYIGQSATITYCIPLGIQPTLFRKHR